MTAPYARLFFTEGISILAVAFASAMALTRLASEVVVVVVESRNLLQLVAREVDLQDWPGGFQAKKSMYQTRFCVEDFSDAADHATFGNTLLSRFGEQTLDL